MYLNKRSKVYFLLLIICFFFKLNARSQGCIDTIVSKQFDVENFGGTFWGGGFQDNYNNFYLIGCIRPLALKSTLVKFNNQKKIVWSKSYNAAGSDGFGYFRRFFGNDNEENLYYISTGTSLGPVINFLKVDSSGNVLNNKFIRVTNTFFGYFTSGINTGKVFSTIITPYFSANGKDAHFVATDKNFNVIRWSNLYKPSFTNYIYAGGTNNSIEIDDTTSIITTWLSYKNPTNLSDTIATFHILKINSLTGNIIQQ
jgi:hypothetical protein